MTPLLFPTELKLIRKRDSSPAHRRFTTASTDLLLPLHREANPALDRATAPRAWSRTAFALLAAIAFFMAPISSPAADAPERHVDGIMDNSFLVEEAYNQEAGVVQHILTGWYALDRQRGEDDEVWDLSFTQEWPVFSQRHQFSYTIPYSLVEAGGVTENGVGDVLLNYRYQAYFNEETLMAFAPRFSLVLPTGDEASGLGEDTLGYQWNLPFSTAIGDSFFAHLNAGLTFLPQAASANDRDVLNYNVGASVIYAATSTTHFLVEWVGAWDELPDVSGRLNREFSCVISPGIRHALNFANDSQLVIGLAAPLGLTGNAPDYGVFFYMSFEHFFVRQ
ncbi:MAG: transporter [Verrucomicrobiota bacterium]